ncbi:MAG: peptidoglycan-associated lipoprotein Pal [Rhodospirillales bacterium]
MRFKILAVFAAVLLAACETAPQSDSASDGGGSSSASTASSAGGDSASGAAGSSIRPGASEDFVVNVGDRVFYDFDKFNLKASARETLERQAAWLKRYPAVTITVEGHCDERGTREYNLALGERRANSAKDYLVALGIAPERVRTISYGKERPAALAHTESAWAQNRRAVTTLSGAGS